MYRTVHFEAVKRRQTVGYTCILCAKKRTKIVNIEHTLNPFNKNAESFPKSRQEVAESVTKALIKEVAEVKAGVMCNKCKDEVVAEREAARKAAQ